MLRRKTSLLVEGTFGTWCIRFSLIFSKILHDMRHGGLILFLVIIAYFLFYGICLCLSLLFVTLLKLSLEVG